MSNTKEHYELHKKLLSIKGSVLSNLSSQIDTLISNIDNINIDIIDIETNINEIEENIVILQNNTSGLEIDFQGLSDSVLLADGSIDLTGNWNLGDFNISNINTVSTSNIESSDITTTGIISTTATFTNLSSDDLVTNTGFANTSNIGVLTTGPTTISGNLEFTSDQDSIQLPNPTASQDPFVFMFSSGSSNSRRILFGHSPSFPEYGLQYRDVGDVFDFITNGTAMCSIHLISQQLSIGTGGTVTNDAKLEIGGTDGALLVPRLTTTQRNALTGTEGMIIYNTTDRVFEGYGNGGWVTFTTS